MKKRVPDKFWFPWWPDKWIFGSVRIECTPAERGIWVDLLSLASKDNGHIRANEETSYPLQQLAGMLIIPENQLKDAINKFIKCGKLTKNKNGTLYITTWEKYQFSERHKRRLESEMSEKTDTMADDKDAILNNNTVNNNKVDKRIAQNKNNFNQLFNDFWEAYPKKVAKDYAKEKFMILMRQGLSKDIIKAFNGYIDYLKMRKVRDNFDQEVLNPATFLMKNRWKDYVDCKYEPPL